MRGIVAIFILLSSASIAQQADSVLYALKRAPLARVRIGNSEWGMLRDNLYRYSSSDSIWYYQGRLPFHATTLRPGNDSIFFIADIVWINRYVFNVFTKEHKLYTVENPLVKFLASPLSHFRIEKYETGCGSYVEHAIEYRRSCDNEWEVSSTRHVKHGNYFNRKPDSLIYSNRLYARDVQYFLNRLNQTCWNEPSTEDFKISREEIEEYEKLVANFYNKYVAKQGGDLGGGIKISDQLFSVSSPEKAFKDTLDFNPHFILNSMDQSLINETFELRGFTSTIERKYRLVFVNEDSQKLTFTHDQYPHDFFQRSWFNPWVMQVGESTFSIRNLDVTRFMVNNFPAHLVLPEKALNILFLFKLGWVLRDRQNPNRKYRIYW